MNVQEGASGACEGIRVLDLSDHLSGSLATMILADYGADVVRVESRERGSVVEPAYHLLNRGKRSITLSFSTPTDRNELQRLAARCDVVVETSGPTKMRDLGVEYETLAQENPLVVYCSIGGFGSATALADVKLDDGLMMAKAGIFRDQPGWHSDGHRPTYRACKEASYFAAMLADQGILAAIRARDVIGRGQHVETSLLHALTCRQNPKVRWLRRVGEDLPLSAALDSGPLEDDLHVLAHHKDPRDVGLTSMLVECKDGRWICHALTEPHFFPAWIRAINFEWIWNDDRFRGAPHRFADPDDKAGLVTLIRERMKERSAAEWIDEYLATGDVCADIVCTTQEALAHPQVLAADYVVQLNDPIVGSIVQVGPLAKIPTAPAAVDRPAPVPGTHTHEVDWSQGNRKNTPSTSPGLLAGPLAGITIVEAAYYYATPFATALLAELGARVIKIEPVNGDPYRRLAAGAGTGDPVLNLGHNNMVRAMQGKESIALNLKDPRGKQILHQLIARADVFVHGFRPGVPESLGMDYETVRELNPKIVFQYGSSYGSIGPYREQPAIDPIIAGVCGQTVYQAGESNPFLAEIGADPIAAAGHATAMMLGLLARHRSGVGQYVESSMVVSNLYANAEDAFSYVDKPPRSTVDRFQYGTGPTCRLYETAIDEGDAASQPRTYSHPRWVFLAAQEDDEFKKFCEVAGCDGLARDQRFADSRGRATHRSELEALLEDVFRKRSALEWEHVLLRAGVGCVVADGLSHFAFLYSDLGEQAKLMVQSDHPSFGGMYWRHAPLIRFSRCPGQALPFCEKGEHTNSILNELGYGPDDIAGLEQDQVIAVWHGEERTRSEPQTV